MMAGGPWRASIKAWGSDDEPDRWDHLWVALLVIVVLAIAVLDTLR